MIELGGVLREEGLLTEAESALAAAIHLAASSGDTAMDARAQVERLLARVQVDPDRVARLAERNGARLELALEEAGDRAGMARLWHLRALLAWIGARSAGAEQAWRRAAIEAELAGDQRMVDDARGWEASSMYIGPTPVDAAIERCLEILAGLATNPWHDGYVAAAPLLVQLRALLGERDLRDPVFRPSGGCRAPTVDTTCSGSGYQELPGKRPQRPMGERPRRAAAAGLDCWTAIGRHRQRPASPRTDGVSFSHGLSRQSRGSRS